MTRPGAGTSTLAVLLAFVGSGCGGAAGLDPNPSFLTRPGVSEVDAPADDRVVTGQTVYVPFYSHVGSGNDRQAIHLATTLYVRNTDRDRAIVVTRIARFDSGGRVQREYLSRPIGLGPRVSIDVFVPEGASSGDASPSFSVEWIATDPASAPVVETVMIGTAGTQGISFLGAGRVVRSRSPAP